MKQIRFFLGLWAAKFLMLIYKIISNEKDDRPGLLAYRFSDDFISRISKPKLVIAVTGTNGKTTVSNVINDILKLDGKTISFNDWGANTLAGDARCLIDSVNIFNKPRKDVAILEMDEMTSPETIPYIKPNYAIITNICRDSIRRNAYPSFILSKLEQAFKNSKDTVLILNADDPISSFINVDNKKIYYSLNKQKEEIVKYNATDFPVCPKCFHEIEYVYQHYRHIGKVKCQNCSFKSIDAKYKCCNVNYDKLLLDLEYDNKKVSYSLISPSIFNVFNTLSIISLFKEMGYDDKTLQEYMKRVKVPLSRENKSSLDGLEIDLQIAKGQNVSATSTVFEHVSHMKENMEIILILDEVCCKKDKTETITWLYETDFSFLNKENIKKIIVGSYLSKDYKVSMMMRGIPEEKIVLVEKEEDTINYVDFKDIDKIMILYEIEYITKSKMLRDKIIEKYNEELKNDN